ncbi:MAG: hypothetical protein AAB505_00390 [Patescibacteria group bacterium]
MNKFFSGLAILLFSSFLFIGLARADWQSPTCGWPYCNPRIPLNATDVPQIKDGGIGVGGPLRVIGTTKHLYVDGKLGLGPGATTSIDATARLDVDGQVRIRGGGADTGKVLVSDANGLATWQIPPGIINLSAGPGIVLNPLPIGSFVTVAINPNYTQRRITGSCAGLGTGEYAISSVSEDGSVTCKPLVMSLPNPTGTGLAALGFPAVTMVANSGGGLTVNANNLLKINSLDGNYGLLVSSNYLKFRTTGIGCSASAPYWKYQSTPPYWTCGTDYLPSGPTPPGNSVMYLKDKNGLPVACPAGWTNLGTSIENAISGGFNTVRTCWRNILTSPQSDGLCQVMYLKQRSPSIPESVVPPSCPSGWLPAMVTAPGYQPEYMGNSVDNNVRTCYKCN